MLDRQDLAAVGDPRRRLAALPRAQEELAAAAAPSIADGRRPRRARARVRASRGDGSRELSETVTPHALTRIIPPCSVYPTGAPGG